MIDKKSLDFIDEDKGDCALVIVQIKGKYLFAFIGIGENLENTLKELFLERPELKKLFELGLKHYILNKIELNN